MSDTLKKITAEAKRIRRAHPNMAWKNAVKQAGAAYRGGSLGKVKGKKKSAPKKKAAKKRVGSVRKKAASPRKRAVGAVISKSAIRSHYKVALGNQLLQRELSTTKTAKRKVSKKIAETKRALKFLS